MSASGRENIDPRLLALMDKTASEEGIFVQDLQVGDTVEIHTKSGNVYTLEVLDPATHRVRARDKNGSLSKEPVETYAQGSSLTGTGTMIKVGWLAMGYRFTLGNILMSRTERVVVNGIQVLPKADESRN